MQYITFVFLAISLAVVHADDKEKCFKYDHSMKKCCKFDKKPDESMKELWKKCAKDSSGKPCEIETCVANEKGLLKDGSIDKDKITTEVEKYIDKEELSAIIKEKCIDQDLSEYGPSDMCPIKKMMHCVFMHILRDCPEWSDEDHCQEMKSNVEECSKLIS